VGALSSSTKCLLILSKVTMVAQIIECKPSETQCTYQLEDGWGRLEARRWVDNSSEEDSLKWGDLT
jgi:replication factor A2